MHDSPDIKEKLARLRAEGMERESQRIAQKSGIRYADLRTQGVSTEALALLSEEEAKTSGAAVIARRARRVTVAVMNPAKPETKKLLEKLAKEGYRTELVVVSPTGFLHLLSFYQFVQKPQKKIVGGIHISAERIKELRAALTSFSKIQEAIKPYNSQDALTGELLEVIISGALANRASDIHFEAVEQGAKIRYRIDGLLYDIFDGILKGVYAHVLSRIKLVSGLKINVHDEAQDGRFSIALPEKEIEVRVAIAPSEYGEVIVMRLLDPVNLLSLSELGLRKDDLEIVEVELKRPNGLVLNTGPTGSGKTTTLYAFLKTVQTSEIKIITIEDPIEYKVPGIDQTQVNKEAGYTFANGLRSLMRQDPDVILVGEIRDKETAEIGMQAALTGHLVFSTVHSNSSAGAVPRLVDLGVRTSSIGPALNLVIAQRLVRRLCEKCKQPAQVDSETQKKINGALARLPKRVDRDDYKKISLFRPTGCSACNNLGYKGRVAVYELLLVGPEMEELITQEASEVKISEFAKLQGTVTMQEDGILKTISGMTTFDEVESVTGPIEWPH